MSITQERTDQLFKGLLDAVPDALIITSDNGIILLANRQAQKMFGYDKNDLLGHNIEDLVPERFRHKFKTYRDNIVNNAIISGAGEGLDMLMFGKNGGEFLIEARISALQTPEGLLTSVVLRDITDRKVLEDHLKQFNRDLEQQVQKKIEEIARNERRFRGMIEKSNDLVMISDARFIPFYHSHNFVRITGWTIEELTNKELLHFIHPVDRPLREQIQKKVLQNPGKSFFSRYRFMHKNGSEIWLEGTTTNYLHNEDIQGIVSNLRDISDRKSTEGKLADSKLIYQTIAANIPDAIIVLLDADYRYILIEGDLIHGLGYSREHLLNKLAADVLPAREYQVLKERLDRVFKGEFFSIDREVNGYDLLNRFIPIKNENNEVTLAMLVGMNVTELKNAHRSLAVANQNLEQKVLARTQQLEMVNRELEAFTYSVSHDLRAPLRIIDGFSNILLEDYNDKLDEEGIRTLTVIKDNARRMGQLIDDLLNLSRLGRKELVVILVDMSKLVQVLLEEMQVLNNRNISITIEPLLPAHCDHRLMRQVWSNLIANAVKYSSKNEHPEIKISCAETEYEIIYSVKDNGVGFDMQYAQKLFGVFQRLHKQDEFEGTGVGLALVQRIIVMHNGKIWAVAAPNEGATFFFSLPK